MSWIKEFLNAEVEVPIAELIIPDDMTSTITSVRV
jgi:hypothetical protein